MVGFYLQDNLSVKLLKHQFRLCKVSDLNSHFKETTSPLQRLLGLMLFTKIVPVFSERHINLLNKLSAQNAEFLNVKAGGSLPNWCALKGVSKVLFSRL
jgi:hypothetical protein